VTLGRDVISTINELSTLTVGPHKAANDGRIGPFEQHSWPFAEKRLADTKDPL